MQRAEDKDVELLTDIEMLDASQQSIESSSRTRGRPFVESATPSTNIPWLSLPNKDQLFLLGLCRLSEPLSNTCLLPYIYYLMRSIIVADSNQTPTPEQNKKISELSGILVAIFPLAQLVTSMPWATWADKYGRRTTILSSLCISALANLGFGFSKSFWSLMFWRMVAGLVNGNVGVMRTMTAEIVKERKFQTKAFLLLPLIFNAGMVFGLAMGGVLADPAVNMSWLFGPNGLLNFGKHEAGVPFALAFPYALPAIFNFVCLSAALSLSFLGLKETLEATQSQMDPGLRLGKHIMAWLHRRFPTRFEGYTVLSTNEHDDGDTVGHPEKVSATTIEPSGDRTSSPKRIWTNEVICALISFSLLPLHNNAFMHIFPVFLSNPRLDNAASSGIFFNGGLGLQSSSIGWYLSLFGLLGIVLQLFIYPRLQARLTTLGVFRLSLCIFPLTYLFAPFLVLLPEHGIFRWMCIGLVAWSQIMARTLAIPGTVILLTNSAPAKNTLSRIHGAGNAGASLARAIGPTLGGWVFAMGMQDGMVGKVWWFYLMVVALLALAWGFKMK